MIIHKPTSENVELLKLFLSKLENINSNNSLRLVSYTGEIEDYGYWSLSDFFHDEDDANFKNVHKCLHFNSHGIVLRPECDSDGDRCGWAHIKTTGPTLSGEMIGGFSKPMVTTQTLSVLWNDYDNVIVTSVGTRIFYPEKMTKTNKVNSKSKKKVTLDVTQEFYLESTRETDLICNFGDFNRNDIILIKQRLNELFQQRPILNNSDESKKMQRFTEEVLKLYPDFFDSLLLGE